VQMLFCGAMSENFREDTAKTRLQRLHRIDLCSRLGVWGFPIVATPCAGKAKDSEEEDAHMAATRSTASVGLTRFPTRIDPRRY